MLLLFSTVLYSTVSTVFKDDRQNRDPALANLAQKQERLCSKTKGERERELNVASNESDKCTSSTPDTSLNMINRGPP